MMLQAVFLFSFSSSVFAQEVDPDVNVVLRLDHSQAGSEVRRMRMSGRVALGNEFSFKISGDVVGGLQIRDLWVQRNLELAKGKLRVGRFKEPLGLEVLTSVKALAFPERSAATALAPGRNTGLQLQGTLAKEQGTWAAGLFYNPSGSVYSIADSQQSETALTTRFTRIPWQSKDKNSLLQLGAAASVRRMGSGNLQWVSQLENHSGSVLSSSPILAAKEVILGQVECAWVREKLQVQAEWLAMDITLASGNKVPLQGWSVQAGWMALGEARPWSLTRGTAGLVAPSAGKPSLEWVGRWSALDLRANGLGGNNAELLSVGLNCYLSDQARLQIAWVVADAGVLGVLRSGILTYQLLF